MPRFVEVSDPAVARTVLSAAPTGATAPAPTGGDDTAMLQALLDGGGTVWLQPQATYTLTGSTGLTIDCMSTFLRGDGTIIDASGMTNGVAIDVQSSGVTYNASPYGGLTGIELIGPGKAVSVTGIRLQGAGSTTPVMHLNLSRLAIHDFEIGVALGQHCWSNNFVTCSVSFCGSAFEFVVTDMGAERQTLIGCNVFLNEVAVKTADIAQSQRMHAFGCSFDFNDQLCILYTSQLSLTNCHVEYTPKGLPAVVLGGFRAHFTMFQGRWTQSLKENLEIGTLVPADYIVDYTGSLESSMAELYGVQFAGLDTTSGSFARGGAYSDYCVVQGGIMNTSAVTTMPSLLLDNARIDTLRDPDGYTLLGQSGSDPNENTVVYSKGTGSCRMASSSGNLNFVANTTASSVNYLYTTPAATGNKVTLGVSGSDTDVSLSVALKGAGTLKVGNNPVGVKVSVPASAAATGVAGQWAADSSYIYVCTATNTWMRAPIATW